MERRKYISWLIFLAVLSSALFSCVSRKCWTNIEVDIKTVEVEKRFEFSWGAFLFTHLEDKAPPIMIKVDKDGKILWAAEFQSDDPNCKNMNSILNLEYNENKNAFEFFNNSYGEPGVIQLDWWDNIRFVDTSYM